MNAATTDMPILRPTPGQLALASAGIARQSPAARGLWLAMSRHYPLIYVWLENKRLHPLVDAPPAAVLDRLNVRAVLLGQGATLAQRVVKPAAPNLIAQRRPFEILQKLRLPREMLQSKALGPLEAEWQRLARLNNLWFVRRCHLAYRDDLAGSYREIAGNDERVIELNLNTELTFSNYKDERRVTLEKGEAFFEVSHDLSHPFVVRAGEGKIRVTGTRFNVWLYEDQVRVNLIEGSVLVTSNAALPGDGLRLGPAMQAQYRHGDYTPQISQTYANDNALAWRNGKLVLDNLALNEALPLINRYLSKPLKLADANTGAIRVGGVYNVKELGGLVNTLPKVLPVYLTRNNEGDPVINSIPRQPPKT